MSGSLVSRAGTAKEDEHICLVRTLRKLPGKTKVQERHLEGYFVQSMKMRLAREPARLATVQKMLEENTESGSVLLSESRKCAKKERKR